MEIFITHMGTATVLLEVGPLRILTDPALDPPGQLYRFGWGTSSRKLVGPVVPEGALDRVDAVLLSHDHHGDNLDEGGRTVLGRAGTVLTTRAASRRLGGNARGLAPWDEHTLAVPGAPPVRVTATPARHGPPGSLPFVGHVVGFLPQWEGQSHGAVYISGDTVRFSGVLEVGKRARVGTAFLHLGGVRFGMTGPVRYTFTAQEAARVASDFGVNTLVPIHHSGWTHFEQPRQEAEAALERAGLATKTCWLEPGKRTRLEV